MISSSASNMTPSLKSSCFNNECKVRGWFKCSDAFTCKCPKLVFRNIRYHLVDIFLCAVRWNLRYIENKTLEKLEHCNALAVGLRRAVSRQCTFSRVLNGPNCPTQKYKRRTLEMSCSRPQLTPRCSHTEYRLQLLTSVTWLSPSKAQHPTHKHIMCSNNMF